MSTKQTTISLIRKYAAIPVFLFCLLAIYIFLSIGYRSVLGPVFGGAVGGLAAVLTLIIFNKSTELQTDATQEPLDYRISIILAATYITSILLIYRVVSYRRPWIHYLIFGAYAGYIAYEIATGASRKRVVVQILILGFFTYWSTQLIFPAGVYGPDTKSPYIPAVENALGTGYVSSSQLLIYLGHLIYVTMGAVLTGLSAQAGYYLLAVLVLTGTLLILSIIDITLPAIPDRVALYAALIFGCMSWTLGRGFHPNKLNFFYPLILLIGLAVFGIFVYESSRWRWLVIATIVSPAIIFGHQFSAGAALIFLVAITSFTLIATTILQKEYRITAYGSTLFFVIAYMLGILGNPVHQGPLLGRLMGLVMSIFVPSGGGGGGPGRYSQLPIDILLVNTSAQAFLFSLAVFGAAIALQQSDWEFDFGIFWMGVLAIFLLISLIFNSADTQPQRFYSLLGLFGLNIFAGVAILQIQNSNHQISTGYGPAILLALFAILSLVSPVAGMHLSPYGDQIPHVQKFDRAESVSGNQWTTTHVPEDLTREYSRLNESSATINISAMEEGSVYVYDATSRTTGVVIDEGLSLGGRQYAFLVFQEKTTDNQVYSNGRYSVYIHN